MCIAIPLLLFDRSTDSALTREWDRKNENKVIFGVFVVLCIHFKKNKTSSIKLIQKSQALFDTHSWIFFFSFIYSSSNASLLSRTLGSKTIFGWIYPKTKQNPLNRGKTEEWNKNIKYIHLHNIQQCTLLGIRCIAMTFFVCVRLSESVSASHYYMQSETMPVRIAHLS